MTTRRGNFQQLEESHAWQSLVLGFAQKVLDHRGKLPGVPEVPRGGLKIRAYAVIL